MKAIKTIVKCMDSQAVITEKPIETGDRISPKSEGDRMIAVGQSVDKIDSQAIVTGRPLYTDDLIQPHTLVIKILRSPYAFAKIRSIDTQKAKAWPGVECVFTWEDVPKVRFTLAGQSYPEPSPYDRLILDQYVRYIGDEVAIVAAVNEKAANQALRLIKVDYEILEPVLDFETATCHKSQVHPESDIYFHLSQKTAAHDLGKNIVSQFQNDFGDDADELIQNSPVQSEHTYYTQATAQCMMETYRSYCYLDQWNRLVVVSSTQVPFHIKRQLARALEISSSRIRVIKPRVGGGFGGKQTSVTEIFAALVTLRTGKPSKIVYDRKETFIASNTRHAMRIKVRIGAEKDGTINGIHMDALSDQGAYGLHAFTTLKLTGEKSLPMYKARGIRFNGTVVYTNKIPGGAFRGYGATQGIYALESAINELADELGMDPIALRQKNMVREGETSLAFHKLIASSSLDRCIKKGKELIGWDIKYPYVEISPTKVRSVGMAIGMQGSGIANIDTSTAQVKFNEEGDFTLLMSATDVGTGTDTIMTQIACETLHTSMDKISVIVADTDITPYDPGSYASSGAYVTGKAVYLASQDLKQKILEAASAQMELPVDQLHMEKDQIVSLDRKQCRSLCAIAEKLSVGPHAQTLVGIGSFGGQTSPPPFMAGFCEVEIDKETGQVTVIEYVGVVDCGTIINPKLVRIQVEGGVVQGIGMALYEEAKFGPRGNLYNNSFFQYKIPVRGAIQKITVDFEESYEPSGPYGAKSIGEVVINTSSPAVAAAINNGIHGHLRSLPMTSEKVFMAIKNQQESN